MKPRYDSISKLKLLAGDLYQVSSFFLWWITLPFYMGYDVIYWLCRIAYNSPTLRIFIKSSFSQLIVCSCFFTLILFAPFPFPLPVIVAIRSILLIGLSLFSFNGIRLLDMRYLKDEDQIEEKMLKDLRKQVNVGVPDQPKSESLEENLEVLALKVRLAELEARQASFKRESELKEKALELEALKLKQIEEYRNSPAYQLEQELATRKLYVNEEQLTKKEEDLGLRERALDKDLTIAEKKAVGMDTTKQAPIKLVKIVRVLQQGLIQCNYQPEIYKCVTENTRLVVGFSVSATDPIIADDTDWLKSLARLADSGSITARKLNKAVEFYVSKFPYKKGDETTQANIEAIEEMDTIHGNHDETVLVPKPLDPSSN